VLSFALDEEQIDATCTLEMYRNVLQHPHSLPFPPAHSHFHDSPDLIPIPISLPKFIPIPCHSHSRLTDERHLSVNNQTLIYSKCKHYQLSRPQNMNSELSESESRIVSYPKCETFKMQKVNLLYCSQKRDVTLQHFIGLHSHRVERWKFSLAHIKE